MISEALWPDTEPSQALNNLYKLCRYLKHPDNEILPVLVGRNEISLDMAEYHCNLQEFEELCASMTVASCEQAVRLYCGPVFGEDYYQWSNEYEAKYDIFYYQILEFLIDSYNAEKPQLSKYYRSLYDKMS